MRILLFFIFIFIIYSCSHDANLSEAEKNSISQEVKQSLSNYYADIQKEGLLAELKYLDSSADFFWVPPEFSDPISYDSIATILKANASLYRSINNTWDSLRIIPLSKELAAYTGKIHSTFADTSGKVYEVRLIESGTVIKRGEEWKLLCGQTASAEE